MIFTTSLRLNYETKHTFRYDAPGGTEDKPPVSAIYISKHAFPDGAPQEITLTVESKK